MNAWRISTLLASLTLTSACVVDVPGGQGLLSGSNVTEEGDNRGDSDDDAGGDGSSDSADGFEPNLDVASPEGVDACQKVDFMFVIDNSGSMIDHQDGVVEAFPDFIAGIEGVLGAIDHHIMVVDIDGIDSTKSHGCAHLVAPAPDCATACETDCPFDGNARCYCEDELCVPDAPECGVALGAGVDFDVEGIDCGFDGYIESGHPDVAGAFECAASRGVGGCVKELPMLSMLEALTVQDSLDGCNDGFLRDDATLVIVVVANEDDEYSPGTPYDWHQSIVDLKGGTDEDVVVLSIVSDRGMPDALCVDSGNDELGWQLMKWTNKFTRGSWTSICGADFTGAFDDAISDIKDASGCRPPA